MADEGMSMSFDPVSAALSVGMSLFGIAGENQKAAAIAKQAQMARENANFQRQWAIDANNRNILKNNFAKAVANRQIESLAISQRSIGEVYGKMGYDNAKSQYSKQTSQINSALLSSVSSRGMSASSGTARALLRQNIANSQTNMANLKITQMNNNRDITTAYQNTLNKRDFNYTELQTFLGGDTSTVNTGTSAGMAAGMAALSGLQSGITTGLQFNNGSSGGYNASMDTSSYSFIGPRDPYRN